MPILKAKSPKKLIDGISYALRQTRPDPAESPRSRADFDQWETDVLAVSLAIEYATPGLGNYRFRMKCQGPKDRGQERGDDE